MKITDINKSMLPIKVKLNNNFNLDESFDVGTILQIYNYKIEDDFEGCYVVNVRVLSEDKKHNHSVAISNFYNENTKSYDLNYFQFYDDKINSNGDYEDVIYVMGDDDCFDVIEKELITSAAIWYKDLQTATFKPTNIDKGIVVCGYRHAHIIEIVKHLSNLRTVQIAEDGVGESEQGFMTNQNRFLNRIEAMGLALKNGQAIESKLGNKLIGLFSEDLY